MWKLTFYHYKSTITLTGKQKEISLEQAVKYKLLYGLHADKSVYQQYPKREYEAVSLSEKIAELANRVSPGMKCWMCQSSVKKPHHYILYPKGEIIVRTVCENCQETTETLKEIDRINEQAGSQRMYRGN